MRVFAVLLSALVFVSAGAASRPRIVGWYDGRAEFVRAVPPEELALDHYTHIVHGAPNISDDGSANCIPVANGSITARLQKVVTAADVKMLWVLTEETAGLLRNKSRANSFIRTVALAMLECSVHGIEFDYEGPVTPVAAEDYTNFLVEVKRAIGPNRVVSADIAVWTDFPYVAPHGLAEIDFVNVMTYFWSESGSLEKYEAAIGTLEAWGFNLSTLNLGVPYYASNQGGWSALATKCPNISPDKNICDNVSFVGKEMQRQLGNLIQSRRIGGAFPWQANYDISDPALNNSLIPWLALGLKESLPPSPPPPPMPVYIGPYIFKTRSDAAKECQSRGLSRLCSKIELLHHQKCAAGWCSDFEGYWMAETIVGCGKAGFNEWSGPAGAFCCPPAATPEAKNTAVLAENLRPVALQSPPSPPPPPPPPLPILLAQSLSCNVTIRSASPFGGVYTIGRLEMDAPSGRFRQLLTQLQPSGNITSDYLRRCDLSGSSGASWYTSPAGTGRCTENMPMPGQCAKTASGAFPPTLEPSEIPVGATWNGHQTIAGTVCDSWQYISKILGNVVWAWTRTLGNTSVLVRFIGDRVQTDYTNIVLGPPTAAIFTPASKCPPP